MSYLSFYSPLLRELGQGSVHLARTMPVWGSDVFFHGNLHDFWGRRVDHGFGDDQTIVLFLHFYPRKDPFVQAEKEHNGLKGLSDQLDFFCCSLFFY